MSELLKRLIFSMPHVNHLAGCSILPLFFPLWLVIALEMDDEVIDIKVTSTVFEFFRSTNNLLEDRHRESWLGIRTRGSIVTDSVSMTAIVSAMRELSCVCSPLLLENHSSLKTLSTYRRNT